MTTVIVVIVLAAVVFALARNHNSQLRPRGQLAGGSAVEDADLSRVRAEVDAMAAHSPARNDRAANRAADQAAAGRAPARARASRA